MNGHVGLKGVSGTATIGHDTIRSSDMERLVVGSFQYLDGR
jgi:hypothetical protein